MEKSNPSSPSPVINKTIKQKKQAFENVVKEYLESNPVIRNARRQNELEIRFGTNHKLAKPITKIDYDNVVKQLYSCGFLPENVDGLQILRIIPETIDTRTGKSKMQIRAEIVGTDLIQEYCRTNSIQNVINMPSTLFNKIKFTKKMTAIDKSGAFIQRVDMDDFNFRVSFQTEQDFHTQTDIARNIITRWMDSKKIFRSMNRVRFYHPDLPIFADLSIVKSSATTSNHSPIPQYSIQDGGVFENVEKYEIELEVDNSKVGVGTDFSTVKSLMNAFRKCIRTVLSGLQGTRFPVSYQEQADVLQEYMAVVHGDLLKKEDDKDKRTAKEILDEIKKNPRRVFSSDFIGPSSFTLQLENIVIPSETHTAPNICQNYTVTDKADGERRLLYVSENGNIYLIDTNMNVIYTGTRTTEKTLFYSLLDGEHIKHDRNGQYINLFAAFDLYYVNKKSVREFAFYPPEEPVEKGEEKEEGKEKEGKEKEGEPITKYRLPLLHQFVELLKPTSLFEALEKGEVTPIVPKHSANFMIKCKKFHATSSGRTIFEGCSEILSNIQDGTYEYNTDGLIFTPTNLAVGGTKEGGPASDLYKITWTHSFKWKPPEFNTIDFLVTMKKDKTGKDEIHHIYQDGRDLQTVQQVLQYKTMVLHVGFNPKKDGFINPFQDVLNDNVVLLKDQKEEDKKYKPVPFVPSEPYDPTACFANIMLKDDTMLTEEGEYFEEDMIVEFKYVMENGDGWRWVPIRVRYDKTAQLRSKKNNFGNAYQVANSNWYSIHHPITDKMISTGQDIPERTMDEDVYYNKSTDVTSTQSLRDFHNLFVKKNLIMGVAHRGDTLIDFAVGKAGDLRKWVDSHLAFVFGIDYSKDNIMNQSDGACVRYLKEAQKSVKMPKGLFVQGDSGINIRSGQAFSTEKDKQVARAVFGQGAKDITELGKGVYQQYGVGELGFNVASCQFALHYFFKNQRTFCQFLRNVSECTKLGGHFIGTCYDGETVFKLLKSSKKDDGVTIMKGDRKIYEVIKKYDETGFPDDDMSLGYPIHVFQESINQYIQEYLVNFPYFIRIMEDFGFVLATKDEARHMGLPDGSAMFSELFTIMEDEIKRDSNKQANYRSAVFMSPEEKRISFMNRYFVFKKVRSVDAKKMMEMLLKEEEFKDRNSAETLKEVEEMVKERAEVEAPIVKKRRLVLKKPLPVPLPAAEPLPVAPEPLPISEVILSAPKFTGETMTIKRRK